MFGPPIVDVAHHSIDEYRKARESHGRLGGEFEKRHHEGHGYAPTTNPSDNAECHDKGKGAKTDDLEQLWWPYFLVAAVALHVDVADVERILVTVSI